MAKHPQKVVSVRLPNITYKLLLDRSINEEISPSALIRNILIGFLRADDTEVEKIRCYGAHKAKRIAESIEQHQGLV